MAQIVILKRAQFFSIDNDIIDVHAKKIGVIGVAIYTVLARYANRRTGQCWPSIPTIARHLHLNVSTVKRHLPKLVKAGLITIEPRRTEQGDQTSHLYTLQDPTAPAAVPTTAPVQGETGGGGCTEPLPPVHRAPPPPCTEHYEQSESPEQKEKNQEKPARAEEQERNTPKDHETPERPDDVLSHLDAPTAASLKTAALTLLQAQGVSPDWMIQPVIQSYMVRLWYQQQHVMHEDRAVGTGKRGTEEGQAYTTCGGLTSTRPFAARLI